MNGIELAIFSGRLNAICEEMGYTLQRCALSPNIKDRLDFSCALFSIDGGIIAQAAHIPVHLGSMAFAMKGIVDKFEWYEGDVVVLNDPFLGGTHLPDVTVIAPLFVEGQLLGFVSNRAHHANIGASSPGSMPLSSDPQSEGVLISPAKLYERGRLCEKTSRILSKVDGLKDGKTLGGDFLAQISANQVGAESIKRWLSEITNSTAYFRAGVAELNAYGGLLARARIAALPRGSVYFEDVLDDDGFGAQNILIRLTLSADENSLRFDFEGTDAQVKGNLNCPLSVTAASVYYVVRCLMPAYAPCCQGLFDAIELRAPEGCLLNAQSGVAVAAGNVETSMRVVDVVMGAFNKLGAVMPAASQGTMNNVAMGARAEGRHWDYYETIGGGMGGGRDYPGLSGVQCHMTNSLNTPIESMESHYPMRISSYSLRSGSGGPGRNRGGDGLQRVYEFLEPASVTLLTERRVIPPWGVGGAEKGDIGRNALNGMSLSGKAQIEVDSGDLLSIETPGGGGFS